VSCREDVADGMDIISKERRSWNMSRIRSKDTRPEMLVRSMLERLRYRFRVYDRNLPGKPDIVLPRRRLALFVHGCFWHRHRNCRFAYTPKSRVRFWQKKFRENVERDRLKAGALRKQGWRVRVIWECETRNLGLLEKRIQAMVRALDQQNYQWRKKLTS